MWLKFYVSASCEAEYINCQIKHPNVYSNAIAACSKVYKSCVTKELSDKCESECIQAEERCLELGREDCQHVKQKCEAKC
ncbi:hypothetical protein PPL_05742 [Heterostelium album PN500]|uniref:Uncharacterized protein n=1 Tax=Heterostelium pallidum (strain ATCC 26659 / Pp 5 / PN500) TaxID=670386 RepID=D3BB11_HETP5|nr:hypothetical protein PPL_05742 [Heterostelium album PN500]EFA81748.1 hypothetical protein PPL_05742 [Heterostelium album PN500]|eukprot:XP_020433865.1 hypothetical protein PPL_05742 [Heterostelium album PN500]